MQLEKRIILYILCTFARSILEVRTESSDESNDESLNYVDENGVSHVMNFSEIPQDTTEMLLGDTYFYLYTRRNPMNPEPLEIPEGNSLLTSTYFNKSNDIRVITHGWITRENVTWLQNMKNSFLKEYELNVITVDWNELSRNIIYPFAACSTRYVGKRVAKLLDALIKTFNVNGDNIHLIGHSLGAHVMGYAGMFCTEKVSRITGLDPARPLFEVPDMMDDFKLDYSDAKYVDIIHTCSGVYGYGESHGHADFYPNNGTYPQPGCSEKKFAAACSHGRAYEYFTESIEYQSNVGFISFPCSSWEKYENGECTENPTAMGYLSGFESRGDYYLHTKNESKYSL
ncbi:unnamed protein product [Danaus chrysippus]|uniref:(African queen) hypothetical protein n=1 Tax=Danaus chrysippus TaxID=151541 RepID=A0A8J2QZK0_9NEOP|nr:unnamed protein product [Danaus chrysippus]